MLILAELETINASERRAVFTTGMVIAGVVVLILAIATMAFSPFLGKSLKFVERADPVTASLFVRGLSGDCRWAHARQCQPSVYTAVWLNFGEAR